ncbi:hypothetical protein GCM10009075_25890 [Sphingomonas trueperi]
MPASTRIGAHQVHIGIAEAGKMLAIKGRHKEALERYREALRLAQSAQAPDVFGRHYLQCVLESLEKLGDFVRVVDLATQAADAVGQRDTPFHRRDRASLLERAAVARLRLDERDAARDGFAEALALAGREGQPLSAMLLDWINRGLQITPVRIAEAQRKHGYWAVRAETVDPVRASRALTIPDSGSEEPLRGR